MKRQINLQPHLARGAAALMMALALPAVAQEAAEPTITPESDQAQASVTAEHEDWIVRCQDAPDDAFGADKLCEMYQQVSAQETEQTVLEAVIGYPQGAEQPIALFNLPLGMRLPPGVELQVDDNDAIGFAVQICLSSGCRADIALDGPLVEQMRAGTEATLTIADPQGQRVQLPLSLMGFSDALDDVEANR
ncbi:invasion associated locus B family protein [Spiribacter sp. 218]|jgi:invasion protein IalB|uniref:invasion associated locus B family protein n=1 Tax=Spiribacter pallidus TaxID=1987936 RepID=UPI00349FA3D5